MSVWPAASHTRAPLGTGIIAAFCPSRAPSFASAFISAGTVAASTAPVIRYASGEDHGVGRL
jgi:hypothetical protein